MQDDSPKLDWLSACLSHIAFRTASYPGWAVGAALLVTCLAIALAATRLEFQTSRLALLSPKAAYNQRWLAYLDRFGKEDDAVIVVSHANPELVAKALTTVGLRLSSDPELSGVLYRQSAGNVSNKALYLMPPQQLSQILQLLGGCAEFVQRTGTLPGAPAANWQDTVQAAAHVQETRSLDPRMLAGLLDSVEAAEAGLDSLTKSVAAEGPLLLEDSGTLGLCLVRMPHLDDEPLRVRKTIERLTEHLKTVQPHYPDVMLGLTGMPVLEWDESVSSQRDMQNATILSLVGVALIFVFGFGSWRMPCVAVICLAMGLVWTVGLATLVVGHLNLFSVAFGAIIAGLGIDYAIHLLSRLRTSDDMSRQAEELPRALANAVAYCGKGIVTGAVTTAAAFAVSVLTPFKGMTELGLICALGTLACLVVTLVVLPAFIVLQARYLPAMKPNSWNTWLNVFHSYLMRGLQWSNRANLRCRAAVLISTLLVTLYSTTQLTHLYYDHNLLNLQADNTPSVQAEHELSSRAEHSAWFAVSMAKSPAAAQALHQRFAKLPSVARVEEIGGIFVNSLNPQTHQYVTACRQQAELISRKLEQVGKVELANQSEHQTSSIIPASFDTSVPVEAQLFHRLKELGQSVLALSSSGPPALADFPEAVRKRMASEDGKTFLLRIFAREDLWNRENLQRFVHELESVDPRVTGHPIQTWYASGQLESSYYQAGIYAVLTVCALLMLDLQSVRLVLLSLIPVGISFIQLGGWLVMMGIPFNAANMIVLPLIIGIGIDDGVHIMHDFSHRGSRRFAISNSTTLAILLTSLTTMIGFGCMGISDHRGLQSLGIVLLTGVGLCLWHSWFTLPAILSYFGPATVSAGHTDLADDQAEQAATVNLREPTVSPTASPTLAHIPVVMSLPDYPELYLNS